jgi:hypothetical protein
MTDTDKRKEPPEVHSDDAWSRFERAVDVVAKSPPQHKRKDKKSPPKSKRDEPKDNK